jgi:trans-aconitate methyltransferase
MNKPMKLYNELAEWWPLLSSPEEYAEEAELYREIIQKYRSNISSAVELGSGGGNTAFHLKKYFPITLTDISPQMIIVSKKLNPDCEHHVGDMREIKLNKKFDLVFIHDAIMYITSEEDLNKVFKVAYAHLIPGGVLFMAPDYFEETFKPATSHGGHDGINKSMRYLEWTVDENPEDNLVESEYAYLLKEETGRIRLEHDRAVYGIFPRNKWKELLEKKGFDVYFEVIKHSGVEKNSYFGIIGLKTDSETDQISV